MSEADSICWINHAGYELRTCGLRIVCDPWIEGLAFADSWALLAKTTYTYEDFAGVDYIWFSHEHPDHFAPANLRKIPEAVRKRITVLYQKTRDARVASFCRNLGFAVREIVPGEIVALSDAVRFRLGVHGHDSWSYIETPQHTYLNMNDCVPVPAFHRKLAAQLPRGVDVLLTQFSYANWVANPGDTESMTAAAARKRTEMRLQIDAYKPNILIPFASYIWFCRSENFHQNAGANAISDIYETFSKLVPECVVLYPGECYTVGEPHGSADAIAHYTRDAECLKPLALVDPSFSPEELQALAAEQLKEVQARNAMWSLRLLARAEWISIHLSDLNRSLRFRLPGGIEWTNTPIERCDLVLSSGSFALMLQRGYGYATVDIGGRMLVQNPNFRALVRRNFIAPQYNERGYSFPGVFFSGWFLKSQVQRRFGRALAWVEAKTRARHNRHGPNTGK